MPDEKSEQEQLREALARRVHEKIKQSSMTYAELAQKLEMSRGSVHRLVNRQSSITVDRLYKICRVLDIDVGELFAEVTPDVPPSEEPLDDSGISGPLKVYFDSSAYSPEEQGELLSLLSELYSLQANDRLVIDSKGVASPAFEPASGPNGGEPK